MKNLHMTGSQLPATISSQPPPLSEAASSLVYHIPQLLRRLRDLENEEAKLDARARQLVERLPPAKDRPSTPIDSAPASNLQIQATESSAIVKGTPSTPPHINPKNIETPVKAFLLMESFTLMMSVKSKRKGRIFLGGNSTEFGEKR